MRTVEEINTNVTDVDIEQLIPNVVDNFLVVMHEDHHTIVLPMDVTGIEFRAWYKGRGGVFSKDVLRHSLNQSHGKYVLVKDNDINIVARLISEEEELSFEALKLIDGKIKDTPYMIFKKLHYGEKLTSNKATIKEIDLEQEDPELIYVSKTVDEDFEPHVGSISLFSE